MQNLIKGFPTPRKGLFMLYVHSCTYNQSKYIKDCLNGVVMQQTDFPFVHHVIDDCSTDGEQEVIKSWIEDNCKLDTAEYFDNDICTITIAQAKENANYTIAAYFLKNNMYKNQYKKRELYKPWRIVCPYEAFCEGDDYWIKRNKLQQQYSYLENHPKCNFVFTARYIVNEMTGIIIEQNYKNRLYTNTDILEGFNPGLQNVCYRTHIFETINNYKGINGDRLFPYLASLSGEIHYIDEITSVYRITGEGVSTKVEKSKWFRHAIADTYRFHKELGFPDNNAYIKANIKYFRPLIHTEGVGAIKTAFEVFSSVNNEFSLKDYSILLVYTIKSVLMKVFNQRDIKEKIVDHIYGK